MATVDEDLILSLYPPPPVYYKFFTEENLKKLKEWKEQRNDQSTLDGKPEEHQKEGSEQNEEVKEETAESTDIEKPKTSKSPNTEETAVDEVPTSEVPGELKFLIPPKQPEGTHYRGYGNIWAFEDKLPTLKDTNWEQLYKDDDELITSETKIKELHKLMDSLLLNFLELIGIVSIDPQQFEHKVKDLSLILININHLLNTYRPHQSRESLIMLLRKQIEAKQQEIAQIEQVSQSVKTKILGLAESIDESGTNDMDIEQKSEDSSTEVRQQEIVQALLAKHL